jgi:hypothetical protein
MDHPVPAVQTGPLDSRTVHLFSDNMAARNRTLKGAVMRPLGVDERMFD